MATDFTDATAASAAGDALVTVDRAIQNAALSALNTADADALATLLSVASETIRNRCHRRFNLQTYSIYLSGGGYPYQSILLPEVPVVSITRLAADPRPVLSIINTGDSSQRATVATTVTGLTVTRVASGVTTASTLDYADYATLSAMADAITALGNGWIATVAGGYGLYPSADLRTLQGPFDARTGAELLMYLDDLPQSQWRLDADTGILEGRFPEGQQNIWCQYTAGYATIPQPVQQACVDLAADMYQAGKRDGAMKSAKIGPFSYTLADGGRALLNSPKIAANLAGYIDHSKGIA